ncbi:uncharacterized protein TNIN_135651 [Trichonephila inaurata madagascariensis]|uniref:Uncharacterized protein n=1 Tax=Trichonephila inaurata madagascariensis TaxID=2747483 RepID=A0A8X7BYY4_9ARAC|nr:uncharacterized protein TNIN_135651 [Trichonephila inaurata madagascariensis]
MRILTLKQIAIIKLATSLFTAREFWYIQKKLKFYVFLLPNPKLKDMVNKKLHPLSYPTTLQQEITTALRSITFEVWHWIVDNLMIVKWESEIIKIPLSWKSDGTINRISTADMIIRSPDLAIETRFIHACQYWCWNKINEFWETLSANEQLFLYRKYVNKKHTIQYFKFFRARSSRRSCRLWSLKFKWTYGTMFNGVFDHLPSLKKQALENKAVRSPHIPLARHCLLRMNAQRRMYMLQEYPYHVLRVCLFWPLQALFTDAASTVRDSLPNRSFLKLIHIIICQKILLGWRDYDYVDLLKTFWRESPIRCKEYVRGDTISEILTVILEGREFRTHIQGGVPRRYLTHSRTLIKNTMRCIKLTILRVN